MTHTITRLYIGLNVGPSEPANQMDLTRSALKATFPEGFTTQHAEGLWEGMSERTLVVTIATKLNPLGEPGVGDLKVARLSRLLKQDCIAVECLGRMRFVEGGSHE